MTTYGTIPPSADDSPAAVSSPADLFSRAKDRAQDALATRRPWREMVHSHAFSLPPSLGEAYLRIRTNFAYFAMNYAIVVLSVVFLGLLWYPLYLIVFVIAIAAWRFLYFHRDRPLVLLGRTFEDSHVLIGLSVGTFALLTLTGAAAKIVGSVSTGFVVVLVHAALRGTDDLAIDEEATRSGGWYASVDGSAVRSPPVH